MSEIFEVGNVKAHSEGYIQIRVLKRIMEAVRSIVESTAPDVWCGRVLAMGDRLNSPFISRRGVVYGFSWKELDPLALFAQNKRYALLLGEVSNPDTVLQPFPKGGLVMKWEGGKVPFRIVEPVYQLAEKLGLHPWEPGSKNTFIYAWVLSPVLWGWHYRAPVFPLANGDKNEPALITGEPAFTQGSLLFIPTTEENCLFDPSFIGSWDVARGANIKGGDLRWFYNHYAVSPDSVLHPDTVLIAQEVIRPVGIVYNKVRYACAFIRGPAIVWAIDHEPVTLPEGEFYALHPLVQD
jgi:hypothetical protein